VPKASDISAERMREVVATLVRETGLGAHLWDVAERLGVPEKVARAKARKMVKRGELRGCACGCRGDFEVP
jgi:hypothetical protein